MIKFHNNILTHSLVDFVSLHNFFKKKHDNEKNNPFFSTIGRNRGLCTKA
ncbi:hypothetical protein CCAND95_310002 [Capnocytophaga canis]|nr:hypothetical protein CCAND95_310002 [Capnocytophaga canis]